ncbi:MAG: 50S ribosomal protein L23 [Verrucomicrobia bacterium]|nr:50S ribosomal protein L23 [Verrucomicrobiota bacterium]
MSPFEVIKSARLTEKGSILTEKFNRYILVVDRRANKIQIRKAVEELFKVKVTEVRTMRVHGKRRRRNTPQEGKSPDWKKAIVTLKQGDQIILT